MAGGERAREVLTALATSANPEERVLAARAIGASGRAEFTLMLHELLDDSIVIVRNASLVDAGSLKQPELWPRLIDAMTPPTATAAAMGLMAGGDAALPTLAAFFDEPACRHDQLVRAARVCGRIGTAGARQLMLSHLHGPHGEVRMQVLVALRRCGLRAQDRAREQVLAQINTEISDAAWLATVLAASGVESTAALLRNSVRYPLQQTRQRLLLLLSFVYDPETIRRVRDHLRFIA